MKWVAAALAAALVAVGCGDDSADETAGAGRGVGEARPLAPIAPRAPAKGVRRRDPRAEPSKLVPQRNDGPIVVERPADPPAPSTDPPARDLVAELRSLAAGGAPRCLDNVGDLPVAITLSVTASVSSSGLVTRAEVSGPGVPAPAAECLRNYITASRMRAPIEGAPRTLTAAVPLTRPTP